MSGFLAVHWLCRRRRPLVALLAALLVPLLLLSSSAVVSPLPRYADEASAAFVGVARPGQQWPSTKDVENLPDDGLVSSTISPKSGTTGSMTGSTTPNRAQARTLQSKYPPLAMPADPKPVPNKVKTVPVKPPAVRGFDRKTSREVPAQRRAYERTYANSDGTHTTEVSPDPLNFPAPDGSWRPVDPRVVADDRSGAAGWRTAADGVDSTFGATADAETLARLRIDDQHEVAYALRGATRAAGRPGQDAVTYPGALPDADLRFDGRAGGFKATLVLNSPQAPHSWVFPLTLKGLTARLVDGRVSLVDGGGKERATIPTGFMFDSSVGERTNDPAMSYGVRYTLVSEGDRPALRVELDSAWLRDPARKYPVMVDPSVRQAQASASMFVESVDDGPFQSDAGGVTLKVGHATEKGRTYDATSFLRFDHLEGLRNNRIFGAQLQLTNFWAWSCQPRPLSVHPITEAWTPTTATGNAGPKFGSPPLTDASFAHGHIPTGTTESPCPTASELIDLGVPGRDLVQDWVTGATPNHGLALTGSDTDVFGWKKFTGHDTANPPRLFITHTPYNADYRIDNGVPDHPVTRVHSGKVKITVTNTGAETWTPETYVFGYRPFTASGQALTTVEAAALPHHVPRGSSVTLDATINPMEPGTYLLDFTMIRKGGSTFTDEEVPPARLSLQVFDVPPIVRAQYPPNGFSTPTLTPQLWSSAVDVDAPPNSSLKYRFEVCEIGSPDNKPVNCFDSGHQPRNIWTVPAGRLSWSKPYQWRSFSFDGASESAVVPFSVLLTDVPQPEITAHLAAAPYSANDTSYDPQVGNYFTSAVDASVATVGPELSITRTYNSLDLRRDGLFGAGWVTRLDMRLVPDGDGSGNVVVTYPDGQQVRFGRNPDGSYAPPPGRFSILTATDDPSTGARWVLTDKQMSVYGFLASGRLAWIRDSAGRTIDASYGQPGRVTSVTSRVSGRTLNLRYHPDGRVRSVFTDAVGGKVLTWTYAYDGERLSKVCAPRDICTTYQYGAGSHYRSVVTDSRPDSYWRLGELGGAQASSQVTAKVGKDKGDYVDVSLGRPGALAGSEDAAAGFNGTSSYVKLPDGMLRRSRDLAVEVWFKTTTGGPLLGAQSKKLGEAATEGVPTLYVGTDGKLRGQFWNGRVAPITTPTPVNNGEWHHVVLSGSLATQTMYLDGSPVGSSEGEIDQSTLPFVQVGAAELPRAQDWPGYGESARRSFAGDIDEVAVYQHPLGEATVRAHSQGRLAAQRLTKVVLPSGKTAATMSYDNVTDRLKEYVDEDGGHWLIGAPLIGGSEQNIVRTVSVTDPAGRRHDYDFDPARNRILRYVAPIGSGVRAEDRLAELPTPTPTCVLPSHPDETEFCGGQVGPGTPQSVQVQPYGVRTFDYDEAGFDSVITDENSHRVKMTRDKRGNVLSTESCRAAGQCHTAYTSYFLNESNPNDPRNDKPTATRDARSRDAADDTYRTSYSYTERGDLESQTMPDGATVRHTYSTGTEPAFGGGTTPPGLVLSTKDARNTVVRYTYFRTGDLAEEIEPAGLITRYGYDELGRRTSETETSKAHPQGVTTTYTYDERSRLASTTGPVATNAVTGAKTQAREVTTYDADGNPISEEISDVTGVVRPRLTQYAYDQSNRLIRETDAEGGVEHYGYDRFGNLVWEVNACGVKTEYRYTARNKLAEVRLAGWHARAMQETAAGASGADDAGDRRPTGSLLLEKFGYDLAGRLVREIDAMGRTLHYAYYDDDLVKEVSSTSRPDSPDKVTLETNTYDAAGNVTEQVTMGGRVTRYSYDVVGRVKETVQDPDGLARTLRYTYDDNGNVKTISRDGKDSNVPGTGGAVGPEVTEFEYDSAGRQVRQTLNPATASRPTTTRTFDERGLLKTETSPRGNAKGANPAEHTTTFGYDEVGQQIEVVRPAVKAEVDGAEPTVVQPTKTMGYDAFGQVTEVRDERGQVSRVEYDRLGRSVAIRAPGYTPPGVSETLVPTTRTEYDAVGNTVAVTDPRGAVTRYRYDQLDRIVEQVDPHPTDPARPGGVWRFGYTHTGEQISTTDPTGARTEATYDRFGRPDRQTTLERHPKLASYTTEITYDDAGNLETSKTSTGEVTRYGYDALEQLTSVTEPDGVVTRFGYDRAGRRAYQIDGRDRVKNWAYDRAGRLSAVIDKTRDDQVRRVTRFTHDAVGNVVEVTDPELRKTRYTYDAADRLTEQVEPVSATESITTTFGYDAAGNRTRYTDGRGNSTHYRINTLGQPEAIVEPVTKQHPNAADRTWLSSYDLSGNAVRLTAPGGVHREREYDRLGRLTKETGAGAEADTQTRIRRYDEVGRLVEVDALGGRGTFRYNDRDALLAADGPAGVSEFGYDGDGRLTERSDASGTSRFGYAGGRLKTIQDSITGTTQSLEYDTAGMVSTIRYAGGKTRQFDYNDTGDLASEALKDGAGAGIAAVSYEYDKRGQLTRKVTAGTAEAGENRYGYDHAGRLTSWTAKGKTTDYGWDAAGNRTRHGAKTAEYDERNRLLADGDYTYTYTARGTLAQRTSSGLAETSKFDAFDRLLTAGSTTYGYDGLDRVLTRNGVASFAYVGASDELAADGTAEYGRGPTNELVSLEQGADTRLTVTDQHGDVVGGFKPGAETTGLVDSAAFDPFGAKLGITGAKRNLGYQGDWTDPATGQVNMGARWYSPERGGFLSRDTVNASAGPAMAYNKYTYGAGSPVNYDDPDGHFYKTVVNKAKSVGKSVGNFAKKHGHTVLDGIGMVPVVGEAADIINGVWYLAEKDYKNAGMSFAGAIPGVGNFATGAKYTMKGADAIRGGNKASKAGNGAGAARGGGKNADAARGSGKNSGAAGGSKSSNAAGGGKRAGGAKKANSGGRSTSSARYGKAGAVTNAAKKGGGAARKAPVRKAPAPARKVAAPGRKTPPPGVKGFNTPGGGGKVGIGAAQAAAATRRLRQAIAHDNATSAAFKAAVSNPMPVLAAALQPKLAGISKSVSHSPHQPASVISDLAENVQDGARIFDQFRATVLTPGMPIIENVIEIASTASEFTSTGSPDIDDALSLLGGGKGKGRGRGNGKDSCDVKENSFTPDTPVVMDAKGTRKAIKDVRVGEKVLATDPTTGRTEEREVTHLIEGWGHKKLVEITVAGDDGAKTLTATAEHEFWIGNPGRWVSATELQQGSMLRTSAGTWVQVDAVERYEAHRRVHNLTVDGIHTYYVIAGNTPVLVHNCGNEGVHLNLKYKDGWDADQIAAADAKVAHLNELAQQGKLVKTESVRVVPGSAAGRLRRAGVDVPRGQHGDHLQDLQLGGSDTLDNLGPLDGSVNTSLGPQIDAQIRNLPMGTKICGVSICSR